MSRGLGYVLLPIHEMRNGMGILGCKTYHSEPAFWISPLGVVYGFSCRSARRYVSFFGCAAGELERDMR